MTKQDDERIPRPIGDDLRPAFSQERSDALWHRIADARAGAHLSPAARALRSPAFALAAAACFMIGGAVLVRQLSAPAHEATSSVAPAPSSAALTRADGSPIEAIAPVAAAASVPLSDGSALRVEKGAVLAPLDVSDRSVVLHLLRGRSSFAVKPGGTRRWVVEAGVASVEVVGTRFSVERDARGVVVQVDEGKVLVRGVTLEDGIARLSAGESLRVPSKQEAAREQGASGPAADGGAGMEPAAPARADEALGAPDGPPASGSTEKKPSKPSAGASRPIDADGLLSRADDARIARDYGAAIELLERVIAEHASDPRAKLAAFTIGRIRDEHLQDLGGAVAAYQRALSLGLSGSLAEDCHARLLRVLGLQVARNGLPRSRLEEAAQRYLQRYPKGKYAAQARAVLDPSGSR